MLANYQMVVQIAGVNAKTHQILRESGIRLVLVPRLNDCDGLTVEWAFVAQARPVVSRLRSRTEAERIGDRIAETLLRPQDGCASATKDGLQTVSMLSVPAKLRSGELSTGSAIL